MPTVTSTLRGQFRNVCVTSYSEQPPTYNDSIMSYLIHGSEICPQTSRHHWQCYCEFKRSIPGSRAIRLFPNSHIERRNGTANQAASYCRKDGSYNEHGTISAQGTRTDLRSVAESISSGESSLAEIAISNPSLFTQYGRGLTFLSASVNQSRQLLWRNVTLEIWWGATGTGKTRTWFERYWPDCYRYQYSRNNEWWCGYERQPAICFDEFNSQIMLSNMLMYCDGHPQRLEVKGAHTYANWTSVTIISNDNPQTFYSNCPVEKRRAFARRVTKVIEFKSDNTTAEFDSFSFNEQPAELVSADVVF